MPKAYLNVTDITELLVAPDGLHIAVVNNNETQIWDTPSHLQGDREDNHDDHNDYISDIAWNSRSDLIATSSFDGSIHVFYRLGSSSIKTRVLMDPGQAKAIKVLKVAFFPDNTHILAADSDKVLRVWNFKNQSFVSYKPCVKNEENIRAIAVSHNGQKILVACDNNVYVLSWNGITLSPTNIVYKGHSQPVNALGFSPADKFAVSAGNDSTVKVWTL